VKLSPETKHSLIIGGGLILAVVLGIIVYKKYEANSQAGQAASDQASQDELAYLESMALSGGAYGDYSGGGSSITIPSAPATQSLASEVASLEQAFGLGSTAAPSTPATSGSSSSGSSSSSAPTKPVPQPPLRQAPAAQYVSAGKFNFNDVLDEPVAAEGSYVA
jgi:hypothetical protein